MNFSEKEWHTPRKTTSNTNFLQDNQLSLVLSSWLPFITNKLSFANKVYELHFLQNKVFIEDKNITFFLIFYLARIILKQALLTITFQLSEKVHNDKLFSLSNRITNIFFLENCTAGYKNYFINELLWKPY